MFDCTRSALRRGLSSVDTSVVEIARARSRRTPRWLAFDGFIALAGAVPSLVGAALGSPLLHDDWAFASNSRYAGFSAAFGTQTRSRPLEGLWNWTEFRLLGTHSGAHLVVLAALNAVAAVLLWRLLDRWLPRPIAVLAAVAWLALPNRASTHLWSTNSPHVFSLVMVLAALLVASREPLTGRRFGAAVALLAVGTVAYEGAICLGVAGLVALAWARGAPDLRRRWVASTIVVMGAIGGWMLVTSPKRGVSPPPFQNLSHLAATHFGPAVVASPVISAALALGIGWCVATVVLPGFDAGIEPKLVVLGLAVIALGAVPFSVGGFPFSVSGFFDRGNLFSDLGTALVFGSLISLVLHLRWQIARVALAAVALVLVALPGVRTVGDYVRAGHDGRRLLAAIDALPRDVRTRGPVTFLSLPSHHSVSEFLIDYDISGALALRYRTGEPLPRAAMASSKATASEHGGPIYQLVGNRLVQR
jgi:hypothetical protein